jgi:hypothetical protein
MSMEASLITYLLAQTAITSIVSTKIKYMQLDENTTLPAIIINRISGTPIERQEAKSKECSTRYQIDTFATSYNQALDISNKIRLALDGYSGTMSGTRVSAIRLLDETDDFEPELNNIRVIQDFQIFHEK